MARFGLKLKRRYKKKSGSYHTDYQDLRSNPKKKKMGIGRTMGSAGSLILGAFSFYVALHYIPAYLGLQKVIAFSELDNSAARLAKDDELSVLSAYMDPLRIKRTYLRAGQSMQVQYALPEGSNMEIKINRCRAAFIVEIFKCDIVSQKKLVVKNDKVGTQRFTFEEKGFYLFDETVIQKTAKQQKFRVVWSRI